MRRTGQTSRNEGITLIELLVVLFIISALAGAMMPLFLQVRQRADLDVCLSNMRQVLIGLQMYTADCGVLPLHGAGWVGADTGPTLQPGVEWDASVLPYVGSEESF
ncbi:MAG: prepilin-type N-terminal cleavage/methylation domain-containing protein, partial [Armatimonadota bacterium]